MALQRILGGTTGSVAVGGPDGTVLFDALMSALRQAVVFIDDDSSNAIVNGPAASLLGVQIGPNDALPVLAQLGALRDQAHIETPSLQDPGLESTAGAVWILDVPDRRVLRVEVVAVRRANLNGRLFIFDDATRENDAELEALHHETRFRSALDGMLDAFILLRAVRDAAGAIEDFTFVEMNAEATAQLRANREALIGFSVRRAFPTIDESGLFDLFRRVYESGVRYEGEYRAIDSRIAAEWVRLQVMPSGDGVALTTRDITEKKQIEQTLREQALHDDLTGLLNRRGFRKIVEHELLVARRTDRHDALLLIDIDGLQAINDELGRSAGDEALCAVADVLRDTTRQSDLVGRVTDDGFLVFAVDGHGHLLAKRIIDAMAAEDARSGSSRGHSISLNIGVAEIANGEEFDGIVARADSELFAMKQSRKPARSVA